MENTKQVNTGAKDILAKLMSQENIQIVHSQSMPTAAFDVDNRILHLPIWENMTNDLYSLLIGHEVGHALFTDKPKFMKFFHENKNKRTIFNIVEDARIERKIKTRFPGIRRCFSAGYKELVARDFFKTSGRELDSYKLLDRINLHFKVGLFDTATGMKKVPFTAEEQVFVDRIEKHESIEEAFQITQDLFAYIKDHKEEEEKQGKEQGKKKQRQKSKPQPGGQSEPSMCQDEEEEEEKEEDSDKSESKSTDEKGKEDSGAGQDKESPEEKKEEEEEKEEEIKSETQDELDKNLQKLNDQKSEVFYGDLPKIDENILIGHREVHKAFDDFYANGDGKAIARGAADLQEFKNENKKVINYLAKEFELKKSADKHSRTLSARTGSIDTNKLHKYKFCEDLFKRITTLPGAKNHGLVMFLDCSSSMTENMKGTIEQLLNLVLFCKKVQIPFEVYGFSDGARPNNSKYSTDYGTLASYGRYTSKADHVGQIVFGNTVHVKQYLSSEMKTAEFHKALIHMMILWRYYGGHNRYYRTSGSGEYYDIPYSEHLHSTPLNECILTSIEIVKKFKTKYQTQHTAAIFLTDGESTGTLWVTQANGEPSAFLGGSSHYSPDSKHRCIIRDRSTRKEYRIVGEATGALLQILKDICQVDTIGFHIVPNRRSWMRHTFESIFKADPTLPRYEQYAQTNKAMKTFKKEGNAEMSKQGYDQYYLILGDKALEVAEKEDLDPNASKRVISGAFQRNCAATLKNRIILSKFIEQIA